jgi:uncharacterized protein (UPF0332 family)
MALEPALWFEKADRALQSARNLADANDLLGASNRAYYALFHYLTGLLVGLGYEPPSERGNWPHTALPAVGRSGLAASFQKSLAMALLDKLYRYRVLADYGDHRSLRADLLDGALCQLGTVIGSEWRGR